MVLHFRLIAYSIFMQKRFILIIPARYNSTRLPGKPLVLINGKTMIQRVYEQCKKVKASCKIVVATDDQRIFNHVAEFGGKVIMTSKKHKSGTDRCFEVIENMRKMNFQFEIAINIQGDEPYIHPRQIETLLKCFDDKNTSIATLVKKISDHNELFDPNCVKVIVNKDSEAIYFSRSPVPFIRDFQKEDWPKKHTFLRHIGIYGYKTDILEKIVSLKISPLEKAESLEQLRWIENGYVIRTKRTNFETIDINTPQDLIRINKL